MATRKMTFSLPDDLAQQLVRRIPSRDRSQFLAKALERELREEEHNLIQSCLQANKDADATAIEKEWDATHDAIEEIWTDAPAR